MNKDLIKCDINDDYFKTIYINNLMENFNLYNLTSIDLYNILLLGKNNNNLNLYLIRNKKDIINKCLIDFNLYDCLSILALRNYDSCTKRCNEILIGTINKIFGPKATIFLKKLDIEINNNKIIPENIYEYIIEKLSNENTVSSSKILIDLCHFNDFKEYLKKHYPTVEFIIKKNIESYPFARGREMVLGGSIIGKLIKCDHEHIIDNWFDILNHINENEDKTITMIGAASTCLVFKVGDHVLKIGENRHTRKIFINHRIIASGHRKFHHDENGYPLFYTETMRYAKVGDVTESERDELVNDLREQGLIWHDDKLENCGVLLDDDENIPNMKVDYEEIAGNIDNPYKRLEFNKRKRRVVVIDNDLIDRDPKSMWTMK